MVVHFNSFGPCWLFLFEREGKVKILLGKRLRSWFPLLYPKGEKRWNTLSFPLDLLYPGAHVNLCCGWLAAELATLWRVLLLCCMVLVLDFRLVLRC